jgi:hypothetical protein
MMRKLCYSEIPGVHPYISKITSHVGFRALICKLQSKRKGEKVVLHQRNCMKYCQEVEEMPLFNL